MNRQPFISLVDQILAAKTSPPVAALLDKEGNKGVVDTSALERQIDEMVYALYNLTCLRLPVPTARQTGADTHRQAPEEIAVVEEMG